MRERICPSLRVARERLCVAQTDVKWPSQRAELQQAIDTIDRLGVFYCPDWSRWNEPLLPGEGETPLDSPLVDGSDQ